VLAKSEILEAYLNLVSFRANFKESPQPQGVSSEKIPMALTDWSHSSGLSDSFPNARFDELVKRVSRLCQSMGWSIHPDEISFKVKQVFLGQNALRPKAALAPHVARQVLRIGSTEQPQPARWTAGHSALPWTGWLIILRRSGCRMSWTGGCRCGEPDRDVLAYVSHSGEPASSRFVDGVQAKRQAVPH